MRKIFRWAFSIAVIFGYMEAESIWSWGDLLNAVTIIINLIALIFLVKYVVKETRSRKTDESRPYTPIS